MQHLGKVVAFDPNAFGAALLVDACGWGHQPIVGESIAVNGCCLTVAALNEIAGTLKFDVIQQTLGATTLGDLKSGDRINLEHAVTPTSLLGGHIVQGHVDGIGTVQIASTNQSEYRLRLTPASLTLMNFISEKGSIAINGVSLTVAALGSDWFEVALIPTTLQLTNLGTLRAGDRVNLETDYLAKIVINYLARTSAK